MSQGNMDNLFQIIAALCIKLGKENSGSEDEAPFQNHKALYEAIDAITLGDAPWTHFTVRYNGDRPAANAPKWMDQEFDVWTRDPRTVVHQLTGTCAFSGEWDYAPYREFVGRHKAHDSLSQQRRYKDFMSANWAWKQCVGFYAPFLPIYHSPIYRISSQRTREHTEQCLCLLS